MNAMTNALKMLTRTPHLREYLQQHDPRALAQAEAALEPAGLRTGTPRREGGDELTTTVRELVDEQGARRVLSALAAVLLDREREARDEGITLASRGTRRHGDKLATARQHLVAAHMAFGGTASSAAGTSREELLGRLRARRAALAELEREVEELEGVLA